MTFPLCQPRLTNAFISLLLGTTDAKRRHDQGVFGGGGAGVRGGAGRGVGLLLLQSRAGGQGETHQCHTQGQLCQLGRLSPACSCYPWTLPCSVNA